MDNIKIIKKINEYEVVINKGEDDGLTDENEFLIYNLGEELFDPESKESLGRLERVCGRAEIKHIQTKMTTLISNEFDKSVSEKTIRRNNSPLSSVFGSSEITEERNPKAERRPFHDVKEEKSLARLIK